MQRQFERGAEFPPFIWESGLSERRICKRGGRRAAEFPFHFFPKLGRERVY